MHLIYHVEPCRGTITNLKALILQIATINVQVCVKAELFHAMHPKFKEGGESHHICPFPLA